MDGDGQHDAADIKQFLQLAADERPGMVVGNRMVNPQGMPYVRYLTNRSSGKMGYAIAEAARRRGAWVTLISGPTSLAVPEDVETIRVRTAVEMHAAVREHFPRCTIAILAAAVADYRPAEQQSQKMKRAKETLELSLKPTADIIAEAGRNKEGRILVGFAAETENVKENARKKMRAKNTDLIVANDVTADGAGFDVDTNTVTLIAADGKEADLPRMSKKEAAQDILDEVVRLLRAARPAGVPQKTSV